MGSPKNFFLIFTSLIVLFFNFSLAQVVFTELPVYQLKTEDDIFFDITGTRKIIPLNGDWKVYPADDPNEKVTVSVPSIFSGKADLVFEKSFSLTQSQIDNYNIKIFFFGLNYTADISVNNVIINRHSGGEFPFSFLIPRDILRKDKSNILTVRLSYELDSENTIPLKQRFLFPQNFGGILRDVYLHLIPNISITDLTLSRNYYPVSKRARLSIN